jgi:hypothetical protein
MGHSHVSAKYPSELIHQESSRHLSLSRTTNCIDFININSQLLKCSVYQLGTINEIRTDDYHTAVEGNKNNDTGSDGGITDIYRFVE